MESVDFLDKHLDPPEYETHLPCDRCHDIFDIDDLTDYDWGLYCKECLPIVESISDDE